MCYDNDSCWFLCRSNKLRRLFVCVSASQCHVDQDFTAYRLLRRESHQFPEVKYFDRNVYDTRN